MTSAWSFVGYSTSNSATTGTAAGSSMTFTVAKANTTATGYQICKKSVSLKVTFAANGGTAATTSAAVSATIYNGATSATATFTAPSCTTNSGWTCVGYNTSSTSNASTWNAGANKSLTISGIAAADTSKTVASGYYHIWKKTVTFTFNNNGCSSSNPTATSTVYNNATSVSVTTPTAPTMTSAWSFVGYSTSSTETTGTAAGSSMTFTVAKANTTATGYQICKKSVSLKVTFAANGGTAATTSAAVSVLLYNGATSTSATFTAPSCTTRSGYKCLGYNTTSTATTSTWNAGTDKSLTISGIAAADTSKTVASGYYHIWDPYHAIIRYAVNGGTITSSTVNSQGVTNYWRTATYNSIAGVIQKSQTSSTSGFDYYYQAIDYGGQTIKGLSGGSMPNYNNANFIKVSRSGYDAIVGKEWICLSGCTTANKTFNQYTNTYVATDFCTPTTGDCNVVLGVNWGKVSTVTLDNQGATTAGTTSVSATQGEAMPSISKPSREYSVKFYENATLKSTKTATYTFGGYYTATGGSGTKYYTSAGESATTWDKTVDTTLYAQWTSASITTPSISAKTNRDVSGWYSSNTLATTRDGGYPVNYTYTPTANDTRYAWYISSAQALADTYWWSAPGYDTSYASGYLSIFRNNKGSAVIKYANGTTDATTRINKYGVGTVAKDKWFMVYVNAADQNTIVPLKYDNQTTLYCHKVYIATNAFNSVNTTALSQTDQLSYQGTVYYGLYNCKTDSNATGKLYKLK